MDMQKAYESAAELYRVCSKKCVLNERPQINFIKDSQDFWYVRDVLNQQKKVQKEYVRYRAQQNQAVELFCTEQLFTENARRNAGYGNCQHQNDVSELVHALYAVLRKQQNGGSGCQNQRCQNKTFCNYNLRCGQVLRCENIVYAVNYLSEKRQFVSRCKRYQHKYCRRAIERLSVDSQRDRDCFHCATRRNRDVGAKGHLKQRPTLLRQPSQSDNSSAITVHDAGLVIRDSSLRQRNVLPSSDGYSRRIGILCHFNPPS